MVSHVISTRLLDWTLALAALPVLLASTYLLVLAALSRRRAPPPSAPPHLRFDVVVPAHDEEAGIASTVASLRRLAYPEQLRRIVVVADNCTDRTAAVARQAGAIVLVRDDPARRGKGYALSHAFAWALAEGFADAVVVVDADTFASSNLLDAFAARLDAGAAAVQARNGVHNVDASWRTRLLAIAFTLFNDVRSLARERLRCSAGLRGNGMCLATRLLRQVPHEAFSVVEDLEYGIQLGLAGHRVHYAHDGAVLSEMVQGADAARSQRRRWEGGRLRLAARVAPGLLRAGLARRDGVLLDLAADLLVPPLSYLGGAAAAGLAVSLAARRLSGAPLAAPWLWGASVAGLAVYVARGWWVSGTGIRGLLSLARAPAFLVWKIGLALSRPEHAAGAWVRTDREHPSSPGTRE
jgi:GT2 family glycosyltransferase